tara:strand:- start:83 stop:331 length:249 start_codon:yes stop_codon:yes gene_type:complete
MDIVKIKKGKPSVAEASRRLENLYTELTERGANKTYMGILMFSFAANKVLENEDNLTDARRKLHEVLAELLLNHGDNPLSWD